MAPKCVTVDERVGPIYAKPRIYFLPLTDKIILNAKPKNTEYTLSDGGGLYLRIKPNGKKLWRGSYQVQGERVRVPLGSYPGVPLKKARAMLVTAKHQVSQGIDPKTNLTQKQEAILEKPGTRTDPGDDGIVSITDVTQESPFRSLALAWWGHWKTGKGAKHTKRTRNRLTDNIFPTIGSIPTNEIEAFDIVRMAESIEARIGHGTDLAQRSIQTVSQIFRYGIVRKVARRNPATEFKPKDVLKPVVTRHQARVKEPDLPALLHAIDNYRGRVIVKYALQLMILVFLRTLEMTRGIWPEVDEDARLWRVPDERMKLKSVHLVPLSDQAMELFTKVRKLSPGKNVIFRGVYSKHGHIHDNSLLEALKKLGYQGIQTGHGFRGLAGTILRELGYRREVIEIQLSHLSGDKTERAYDSAEYLEERRQMMQGWADYIDKARAKGHAAAKLALPDTNPAIRG
jgi:integrase